MELTFSDFIGSHRGKRVAVCGVGVSNLPLIKLLRREGIAVEARDRKPAGEIDPDGTLEAMGCKVIAGDGYLDGLDADIIYRSPGMRPDLEQLETARKNGSKITSEMEVFFEVCPCRIIGITGSDGKTTTSSIIAEMLKADGKRAWLGGNIGTPLLDKAPQMKRGDFAVVELSSFQLMTMKKPPDIAVVTNVTPNHLDMHSSMEEYVAAKRNILGDGRDIRAVLNFDNGITREFGENRTGTVYFSSSAKLEDGFCLEDGYICRVHGREMDKIIAIDEIKIPGMHNVENYMAAVAALWGHVDTASMAKAARTFAGVEHRIEFVRELDGVSYYNNSIGTSPTRTVAALKSFGREVILIAGGYDKHIPFEPLAEELAGRVKLMILCGATAKLIRSAAEKSGFTAMTDAATFEEAVRLARENAESGDIVLLSPACAAFDMFKNFAERGDRFKELVREIK
ncbi:MAG: UDP-N-acetylmuramoyl-L-alanine--D-glutamate ligase [Oscillospiraceae bacterium]|nr:UDP-N-acetylmuramoyl-L-alanine--D-glutamate ligase [Oscillospiraceae bacterium]